MRRPGTVENVVAAIALGITVPQTKPVAGALQALAGMSDEVLDATVARVCQRLRRNPGDFWVLRRRVGDRRTTSARRAPALTARVCVRLAHKLDRHVLPRGKKIMQFETERFPR